MLRDILKIAIYCVILGGASIPFSFNVNSNPIIVWFGNALGSLFSAAVVIYIAERITSEKFKKRVSKRRVGKKIVKTFDEGSNNKGVVKASGFIDKFGLRLFSLFCPIFPGVLISTSAVYLLNLDKQVYKRWMFTGVFFVSGAYVVGYWLVFVK